MKCPKCGMELIIVERNNIQLDYCMFCKGLWFDNEELKYLSEALPDLSFQEPEIGYLKLKQTDEKPRRCPRCNKKMDKVIMNNKPPVLDMCEEHGFWFDEQELAQYVKNNQISSSSSASVVFLGEVLR